ncbi:Lrp/AsnC family transcriptional regulator [Bosea sp. 685]|uniref:Lrp/AsnC family transcriptional regulator n=1 Tax=Bosea sp. 685 TaxID=3080057 RepID=UPI002893016B|nr:Lrp/AsnC family transcriptional regulator [Bosea sp. 685]WNJ88867.1 Lrp/AsnC family transcriptional regulator [Bosea sp. 685]
MMKLDAIDRRIVAALQANGRMSTLEVAERVGLSASPCSRRIKALEEAGVIEGYGARINPGALGLNISVVVSVRLGKFGPEGHQQFQQAISGRPEITQWLLVTGSVDYLLSVRVKDIEALREFVTNTLQSIPIVAETSTMVVLETGHAARA